LRHTRQLWRHPELRPLVVADRFAHRVAEGGELDGAGRATLDEDAEIAALVEQLPTRTTAPRSGGICT